MLVKLGKWLIAGAGLFVTSQLLAAGLEAPVNGTEKLVVSITEGTVTLQSSPTVKSLQVRVLEGSDSDFQLSRTDNQIEIRSKDQLSKSEFGKTTKKKKDLEILFPATMPVDAHLLEGTLIASKLSKDLLAHVQKGKLIVKDCSATLRLHSQKGEVFVSDSTGRLSVDSYGSNVVLKNYTGDIDVQNFAGDSTVEKTKGFLSLNLGSGSSKILGSSGSLQFELGKGVLSVASFGGRVEGQTAEGPVNVTLAPESDLNVKSQSGKVTVNSPPNSGALLNIATVEGDIYGPSYLKVSRDSSNKMLRGRLKGDSQKSSIVIRGQEASIFIK